MGHPKRGGDPTVAEWLHEFDVYARQTGVKDVDRAVALLDHLAVADPGGGGAPGTCPPPPYFTDPAHLLPYFTVFDFKKIAPFRLAHA